MRVTVAAILALVPAAGASQEIVGAWSLIPTIDRLENTTTTTALSVSQSPGTDDPRRLFVTCLSGSLAVAVETDGYWGPRGRNGRHVTYRIDQTKAVSGFWSEPPFGKSVRSHDAELIASLQRGQRLLVQVRDARNRIRTGEFSLVGADTALPKVVEQCKSVTGQ